MGGKTNLSAATFLKPIQQCHTFETDKAQNIFAKIL